MTTLTSLIRLRKHTVDQKQKFLAELYRRAEVFEAQKQELKDQIAKERKILEEQEMLEALAWYGRYAEGVKTKIDLINKDIINLEKRIDIARADLRAAFTEMKKIEITDDRRKTAERKAQKRKEDIEMDEIGVEGFRRQEEGDRRQAFDLLSF